VHDAATSSSPFVEPIQPITESDDEIRAILADAEVPPLLPALAYLTGDLSLLREDLRPNPLLVGMPQGGLTDEQQATARELAAQTLIKFRDAGGQAAPVPDDTTLLRIMEYAVGTDEMADYLPLLKRNSRTAAKTGARPIGTSATLRPTSTSASPSSAQACRASSPRTVCSKRVSSS
jgi:4-hydroxyacetophenone monooxygenase